MQETISDTQWQTFQDLGSVRLGRVVTDEELEELRRRIDSPIRMVTMNLKSLSNEVQRFLRGRSFYKLNAFPNPTHHLGHHCAAVGL